MRTARALARHLSKTELLQTLDVVSLADKAGTEEQFRQLIARTAGLIPLQGLHACFATLDASSRVCGLSRHLLIDYPQAFVDEYLAKDAARDDPTWPALLGGEGPLIWHELRARHRSPAQQALYRRADAHGLHDGFTFGMRHSQLRCVSAFAVACEPRELRRHPRHIALIDYLMPHLHAALARIQLNPARQPSALTEREREVMAWAKFGKTDQEIALQLGVSARTVKFHIDNAMHKLQASNRVQAAAIALSQGLIDWG